MGNSVSCTQRQSSNFGVGLGIKSVQTGKASFQTGSSQTPALFPLTSNLTSLSLCFLIYNVVIITYDNKGHTDYQAHCLAQIQGPGKANSPLFPSRRKGGHNFLKSRLQLGPCGFCLSEGTRGKIQKPQQTLCFMNPALSGSGGRLQVSGPLDPSKLSLGQHPPYCICWPREDWLRDWVGLGLQVTSSQCLKVSWEAEENRKVGRRCTSQAV